MTSSRSFQAYDTPMCACKLSTPPAGEGAPLCYFGSACDNSVTCPTDTLSCNYRKQVRTAGVRVRVCVCDDCTGVRMCD